MTGVGARVGRGAEARGEYLYSTRGDFSQRGPPTLAEWGTMDSALYSRATNKTIQNGDQLEDPGILRAFEEFAETRILAGPEDRPDRPPLIDPNSRRARKKVTLTWQEIPAWQQDNEYILTGYRRYVEITHTVFSASPPICSKTSTWLLIRLRLHLHGTRMWRRAIVRPWASVNLASHSPKFVGFRTAIVDAWHQSFDVRDPLYQPCMCQRTLSECLRATTSRFTQ